MAGLADLLTGGPLGSLDAARLQQLQAASADQAYRDALSRLAQASLP